MKEKQLNKISRIVLFCTCILLVTLLTVQSNDSSDNSTTSNTTSTTIPQINKTENNSFSVSSEDYYVLVENTCKKHIENTNFEIYRINTVRIPYYEFRFISTKEMTTEEFKAEALEISENIYNSLIEQDYYIESFFSASREIISLDFYEKKDSQINDNIIIQFDLTDIDKNKSFRDNLKLFG